MEKIFDKSDLLVTTFVLVMLSLYVLTNTYFPVPGRGAVYSVEKVETQKLSFTLTAEDIFSRWIQRKGNRFELRAIGFSSLKIVP